MRARKLQSSIYTITAGYLTFHFFFLFFSVLLFIPSESRGDVINLSAEKLEYVPKANAYMAKGSVKIVFQDTSLEADEMLLNSETFDALITGNIIYEDPDATIQADRIELNLKTKLGTIYECYLFYKEQNFHLRSGQIRKVGEKTFLLDRASVTTCDADPPEWSVSARDITVKQHENLKGSSGKFYIKNTPVLYTPYFWAPLTRKRQTGLLFPSFGFSSTRGYYYKQGFFWAIKENQDASFYLDYYEKKDFAEGFDYRYKLSPETYGEIWMYQVEDREPSRSLFEIKSYHNHAFPYDISGYLKIHAVSHHDYYETMDSTSHNRFGLSTWDNTHFGLASEERLQKYLESDMQISKPFSGGRTYLLAQGRQSLEGSSEEISQSLPEIAFIINTRSKKFISLNTSVKGVNFWREDGQEGRRFDINPNLFFSFGRILNITQRVGARETLYFLNEPTDSEERFIYDLNTSVTTKFLKKYSSFVHLIEPSIQYDYIPSVDQEEIPLFDSIDFIPETSSLTYSLTNRISGFHKRLLESRFRLSQSYDFLAADEPFSPLLAEATLSSKRLNLSMNASYDVDDNIVTDVIGSMSLRSKKGFVAIGKNFRRATDLDQYTFGAGINSPIKIMNKSLPIALRGKVWYDVNTKDIQQMNVTSVYSRQCWGLMASFERDSEDYQILVGVQFRGIGEISTGLPASPIVFSDPEGKSMAVDPYSEEEYKGPTF